MTQRRCLMQSLLSNPAFRLPFLLCAFLYLAAPASAQERVRSFLAAQEGTVSGLIEGIVTGVQGTKLTVAGVVTLDISKAVMISPAGEPLNVSITPGMCIRARIAGSDDASSTLIADVVRVQPGDEVVLSGALQAADPDNGAITLLNRRILVTSATLIPTPFNPRKLKAGLPVSVIVKTSGAELVAAAVYPRIVLPLIFP